MPTLILKQKITKGYEHWLAAFDGAEELRSGYGIKTIYRGQDAADADTCLLYTSPSPRDGLLSRMPSSA